METFIKRFQGSKQKKLSKGKRQQLSDEPLHEFKRRKLLKPSFNFGDHITTEILLRLPVKSILKFKTVFKSWNSILSSKGFRQTHAPRQHGVSYNGLFFPIDKFNVYGILNIDNQIKSNVIKTVPCMKRPDNYKFMSLTCMSSCNGLLLFKYPSWNSPKDMLHVYNPTTKELKALVDIPSHIISNKFVCASLAFDPSESLDYKVIVLREKDRPFDTYRIEVYSSATGICEAPESNTFAGNFYYSDIRGIFCNSAIHWLSYDATLIVYFNVHTKCIKQLRTPELARGVQYFGESQGRLHLINTDNLYFYKSSVLDVYELKGDYSGWFQIYQVDLASITSVLPQQVNARKNYGIFMSIFRREEDDDSTLVFLACKEWVKYNFNKKTTKRQCKFVLPEPYTSPSHLTYWFNTHQFIPTLTCI